MTRDAGGRWTSDGRTLLLALLAKQNACEVARQCHVTPAAISLLATGVTREPSLRLAFALERFGITPRSWLTGGVSNVSRLNRAHGRTDSKARSAAQ